MKLHLNIRNNKVVQLGLKWATIDLEHVTKSGILEATNCKEYNLTFNIKMFGSIFSEFDPWISEIFKAY